MRVKEMLLTVARGTFDLCAMSTPVCHDPLRSVARRNHEGGQVQLALQQLVASL